MKISFLTYGCKSNQYETELIKQIIENYDKIEIDSSKKFFLINTCTVTEKVDREILKKIRQIKNKNKNNKIILTGCLIQRKDILNNLDGVVDYIIPNSEKFNIKKYPFKTSISESDIDFKLKKFSDKNKVFIKIEDGCNRFCSYCEIPFVRGSKIYSRDINEVYDEVLKIVKNGFKEVIFTGINLGLYGYERQEREYLLKLLKKIVNINEKFRIRLSSIGPKELSLNLIDFVLDNKEKICPHFHISLQSGDNNVLKRMNRNYNLSDYEKKVNYIIKRYNLTAITTDIITGFPGETDKEFENTYNFVKNMPFSRLHIFSYSDRPDTKASKMKEKIEEKTKKQRTKILIALGKKKEREFLNKNMGSVKEVLVESESKKEYLEGYTENYIKVKIPYKKKYINELIKVKIKENFLVDIVNI